jgi:hypothetical protein
MIINLSAFKESKKYKKLISDMEDILKVLTATQKALHFFKHYQIIQTLLLTIETDKGIVETYKKKFQYELQKNTKQDSDKK